MCPTSMRNQNLRVYYLAVMALLLLVIPSRILKRYRDAVAALEALEKEESPPPKSPPRSAATPPPAKSPARSPKRSHLERREAGAGVSSVL